MLAPRRARILDAFVHKWPIYVGGVVATGATLVEAALGQQPLWPPFVWILGTGALALNQAIRETRFVIFGPDGRPISSRRAPHLSYGLLMVSIIAAIALFLPLMIPSIWNFISDRYEATFNPLPSQLGYSRLKERVNSFSDKLVNFEQSYQDGIEASAGDFSTPFAQRTSKIDELESEERAEYAKVYLPEARLLHDELLHRLNGIEPCSPPHQASQEVDCQEGQLALQGSIAGASPLSSLATYLRDMVNLLPNQ